MTWAAAFKIGPWVLIALLAGALLVTRGKLEEVRLQAKVDVAQGQRDQAKAEAAGAQRVSAAVDAYATRTAALQPLVVRSTDTVTRYAETPAGRAPCAASDRVLGIDQLDQALFPTAPTVGRAGAVPTDAGASPARRDSD